MNLNYLSTENYMFLTAVVIGLSLVFWGLVLLRKRLIGLRFSGFWAWVAFLIYFVLNPVFAVYSQTFERYDLRLMVSGRGDRALWILAVIWLGINFYFIFYLATKAKPVKWKLSERAENASLEYVFAFVPFLLFGIYSLLFFRSGLLSSGREIVYSSSRFVGSVIGYEDAGYLFMFVPIIFLLLQSSSTRRLLGYVLFAVFILLTIPVGWARFGTLSIAIALLIVNEMRGVKKSTQAVYLFLAVFLAAILQIRGHVFWDITTIPENVSEISQEVGQNAADILGGQDTAMLATFYLESYFTEQTSGWDYGIPTVNYLLTGWIPTAVFPQKYFLVDWLRSIKFLNTETLYLGELLYGGKSTLFGSFYTSGWLIGVILGAILMGFLTRKMDGMLQPGSPILVRTLGVCWFSVLWIVWGSNQSWGVLRFGVFAIPAIAAWLLLPKEKGDVPDRLGVESTVNG